jgi:MFS family permease
MLIAGHLVYGIGLDGVNMLIDIVVCDLAPLREPGQIIAIVFVVFSVSSSTGPFVGGAFTQHVTWRWAFYISLPIAGGAMLIMVLFLQVHHQKQMALRSCSGSTGWKTRSSSRSASAEQHNPGQAGEPSFLSSSVSQA